MSYLLKAQSTNVLVKCDMAESDNFVQWATESGLKENAIAKLQEDDLNDRDVLKDFTDKDVKDIGLTTGMTIKLIKAIKKLNTQDTNESHETDGHAVDDVDGKVCKVTVAPPQFLEPLQSVTCLQSKQVLLEVTVTGHPHPEVTWSYEDGRKLDNIKEEQNDDKYTLIMSNVTEEQTGEINVTARNAHGFDSSSATLRVVKKIGVVLCNVDDDLYYNADIEKLEDMLKKDLADVVDLHPTILAGSDIIDYLKTALQENDYGIIKVPKSLVHVEAVVSQTIQWQNNNKFRKVIPIYTKPDELNSSNPEFLCNKPLFMKNNDGTDRSTFKSELRKALTEGQAIDTLYPLGDASKGLAINYLTPMSIMLSDEFQKKFIEKCEALEKAEPDVKFERVEKTIIACPKYCTCALKLSTYGEEFNNPETIELKKHEMLGLPRDFTMSMYKLKQKDKVSLVRIEIPNILTTLHKMSENDNGTIKNVRKLTKEQMTVQRDSFVREFDALLQLRCHNRYLVVDFDEKQTENANSLAKQVLEAIENDKVAGSQSPEMDERRNRKPTAFVIWDRDAKGDEQEQVEKFEKLLKANKIDVVGTSIEPEQVVFDTARKELPTVFVWITNGTLSKVQKKQTHHFLYRQDQHQFVQVIPVIADTMELTDYYLKSINYLQYRDGDADFETDAVNACTGTMPLAYPLGPVYHGLVWTTALNYLKPVMPKKSGALTVLKKSYDRQDIKGTVYTKAILLIERYCRDNEGTPFEQFKNVEKAEIVNIRSDDQAVATERKFAAGIYKVTYNNEVYYAAIEFVRAITCLNDIKKSKQVPLTKLQMEDQCNKFNRLFCAVAYSEGIKEHCALLHFDADDYRGSDNKMKLNEIVGEFVQKKLGQCN